MYIEGGMLISTEVGKHTDPLTHEKYPNLMGTYDRAGNFHPQCVGLGVVKYTQQPGLFTGGYLAMPLSWKDYEMLRDMEFDRARNYVAGRWHFLLVNR